MPSMAVRKMGATRVLKDEVDIGGSDIGSGSGTAPLLAVSCGAVGTGRCAEGPGAICTDVPVGQAICRGVRGEDADTRLETRAYAEAWRGSGAGRGTAPDPSESPEWGMMVPISQRHAVHLGGSNLDAQLA